MIQVTGLTLVRVDPRKALQTFVEARNEIDPSFRERLLRECLEDDATFESATSGSAKGREQLSELIATHLHDPFHWVELQGDIQQPVDELRARWRIKRSNDGALEEAVVATPSPHGKLMSVRTVPHESKAGALQRVLALSAEHPLVALGVAAAALYVVLRLPLGLFYNDLGVTPEEVGFTNEYLLRQSIVLLMLLVLVGAAATPLYLLFAGPLMKTGSIVGRLRRIGERRNALLVLFVAIGPLLVVSCVLGPLALLLSAGPWFYAVQPFAVLLAYAAAPRVAARLPAARRVKPQVDDQSRRSEGPTTAAEVLIGGIVGGVIGVLLFTLPWVALLDADSVRGGGDAGGRVLPWRAVPANLRLADDAPKVRLTNDCKNLRFLGEADGRVILFDTKLDQVFRVPADKVAVGVSRDC